MRSLARESVFKYLFSRLFNPDDEGLFAVLTRELKADDKAFADKLLDSVLKNERKYSEQIERLANGYQFKRIFNADKCALFIGMAEYDNFKETPVPVIIDEAVKLAAVYSTEKSTDFVNGILAEYVRSN